jgi:hypothetical protein
VSTAPEYRYTLDAEYLRTAEARALALLPAWRGLLVRYALAASLAGLCLFWVWKYRQQPAWMALTVGVTVVIFGIDFLRTRKQKRGRFKGTPLENARVTVVLAEERLEVVLDSVRTRCDWGVISKARAFEDGLLLLEAGNYRWLPHASLCVASRQEAEERVRTKVADFGRAP